jgi:hypothetical protein
MRGKIIVKLIQIPKGVKKTLRPESLFFFNMEKPVNEKPIIEDYFL